CEGSSYSLNGHVYTNAGVYFNTLQNVYGCDSIIVTQLTVNPKPATSAISGIADPEINSIHNYSVINTTGSTYNWIITNGTQTDGGNTNNITVQWGNIVGNALVKVIETNSNGCIGDTVSQITDVTLP